jgi:hypothetical protein
MITKHERSTILHLAFKSCAQSDFSLCTIDKALQTGHTKPGGDLVILMQPFESALVSGIIENSVNAVGQQKLGFLMRNLARSEPLPPVRWLPIPAISA